MERPQLEEHVCPREVELQKALPNAFIRVFDQYLLKSLLLNSTDNAWDLLHLYKTRAKEQIAMSTQKHPREEKEQFKGFQ